MSLSLGSVQFNPINSILVIQDLDIDSLDTDPANSDILEVASVHLDLNIASLWKKAVIADALLLNNAHLTLRRHHDNSLNIDNFLPGVWGTVPENISAGILSFPHSLNNIAIAEGTIIFDDMVTAKTHRVEELRLRLPTLTNVSYQADEYLPPEFSAIINGSPLKLSGGDNVAQSSPGNEPTRLSFTLQSLDLPLYAHYFPLQIPFTIKKGEAELHSEISFQSHENSSFQLNISFQALVTGGLFTSQDGSLLLETPSLRLEGTTTPFDKQLSLKNVLFRDPLLTLKDSFSLQTLASFLPDTHRTETISGNSPSKSEFSLDLLIVDNGSVLFQGVGAEYGYDQLQMSIRNYVGHQTPEGAGSLAEGSFLINGESNDGIHNFTWQGSFDQGMPVGDIVVNNFPISGLTQTLFPEAQFRGDGSAEIRGKLHLLRSPTLPISYAFERGKVILSSFNLKQGEQEVLQSPEMSFSPVLINDDIIDLGNIVIEGGQLNIKEDSPLLPLFFHNEKRDAVIKRLDYQGDITFSSAAKNSDPLVMRNAHLKYDETESQTGGSENFLYSAELDSGGTVNAKGVISMAPLDGLIDITITNTPAYHFLPGELAETLPLKSAARINATGQFALTDKSFNGAAEISEVFVHNRDNSTSYSFDKSVLGKVIINYGLNEVAASEIAIENLGIIGKNSSLESPNGYISSLATTDRSIHFGNISLADTRLTLPRQITEPLLSLTIDHGFRIDELNLSGNISLGDQDQGSRPFAESYSLILRNVGSGAEITDNFEFSASIHERGKIEVQGGLTISPLRTKINISFEDLPAAMFSHFQTKLNELKLQADMDGQVSFIYPVPVYSGSLTLKNGSFTDKNDTGIRWAEATLENFQLRESPFQLIAERCFLKQPEATFTRSTLPIVATLQESLKDFLKGKNLIDDFENQPIVVLKTLDFDDGRVDFRDENMSPPWQTEITQLAGEIDNFYVSPLLESSDYTFRGQIKESVFNIGGAYDPGAEISGQLRILEMGSFPLVELKDQLDPLFALDLSDSLLSVSLHNQPGTDTAADLAITPIEASDVQSPTALAIALLSYDNETLSANVPLTIENQSFFQQVSNHFQRIMVKASISPYLLLQEPFDSLEDNRTVSFSPGTAQLSSAAKELLTTYGMLLENHPRLMLKLQSTIQRSADTIALREILTQREAERVIRENERRLEAWQRQQRNREVPQDTVDSIAVSDIPAEQLVEFTPITSDPIVITDTILEQLARERADTVRNFITAMNTLDDGAVDAAYQLEFVNTLDLPVVHVELAHRTSR